MFIRTTAINKILRLKARKKVIQGGSSAGKTVGILPVLIDMASRTAGLEISVVAESIPHLRRGALKDFLKIMRWTNRFNPWRFNKSLLTYTFQNGSYIEFFSAEDEGKVRGARRNILYVNEANNLEFDTYHQLAIRTSGDIFLDFNPTSEFWAHTEVLKESDSELLILTYKDNEALPPNVIDDFDNARRKANEGSKYWQNWCRVYIDGHIGNLQGAVFEEWEVVDSIPEGARLLGHGMDFGWEVPAALIDVYEFEGSYVFDERIYETKLTNQDLGDMIIEMGIRNNLIYADSAEPKSIYEIQSMGVNIHACDSKQDINSYAIKKMQNKPFFITKRSEGMINEIRNLVWGKDIKGVGTGKPKKGNDHAFDAVKYFIGTIDKYDGKYR